MKIIDRATILSLLIVFILILVSKVFNVSSELINALTLYAVITVMCTGLILAVMKKKRGGK